jgi:hypothetical protein
MLKLSFSFESLRFILLKIQYVLNGLQTVTSCVIFQFLTMLDTIVVAGAVGAGAASRYGTGSNQIMRLRLHNTDRDCLT